MTIGLGLVLIACLRLLIATGEATWKAAVNGDGANVVVSGGASAMVLVVAVSAVLMPALWLGAYDWTIAHAFGAAA